MNVEKQVDFDGYNVAVSKRINPDGSILCDLKAIDAAGNIVRYDIDISFDAGHWPFELTEEDVATLQQVDDVKPADLEG